MAIYKNSANLNLQDKFMLPFIISYMKWLYYKFFLLYCLNQQTMLIKQQNQIQTLQQPIPPSITNQNHPSFVMPDITFNSPKLTPLKQNNLHYQPTEQQILSYAEQVLELNLYTDRELLYLAEQALKAPLPQGWEACEYFQGPGQIQDDGRISEEQTTLVYRNKITQQVSYDHPLDVIYKEKARKLKLLKNTAKYSEYVTPISEELMESSVVMPHNSQILSNSNQIHLNKKNQDPCMNNNSSNRYMSEQQSKSKVNNKSKLSELVRNITEESVAFDGSNDEFDDLSLRTDYNEDDEDEDEGGQGGYKRDGVGNIGMDSDSHNKDRNLQHFINQEYHRQQNNKNPSTSTKIQPQNKPKTIKPINIPSKQQLQHKKHRQSMKQKRSHQQLQSMFTEIIFKKFLQINNKNLKKIQTNIKESLGIKELQQKMILMKEFGLDDKKDFQIQNSLIVLRNKKQELKKIQIQNDLMDQKINQMIKLIEIQKSL